MIICDTCTAQMASESWECKTCDDTKQYCKACLKKLQGEDGVERYCATHWDTAKNIQANRKILSKYVRQFWKELGIPVHHSDYGPPTRVYGAFNDLELTIEYSANHDENGNLISINHVIDGLVAAQKTYVVPIYNHEEAKTKIRHAIMVVLKSKKNAYKSAKSKKLNDINSIMAEYDSKIADVDNLIEKWTNGDLRPVQEQISGQHSPSRSLSM